jgi:uncharacterized protein (AIM24 family)
MKTISHILVALATVVSTLVAQSAEQGYFPFRIGSSGQDYGKAIGVDGEDNIIVAALYNLTVDADPSTNGATSMISAGGTDILLAKYTPYGSLLWAKSMGGGGTPPSVDAPHAVAADSSNNVVVAGYFGSATANGRSSDFDPGAGTALLTAISGYDAFLAKYDRDGSYLWALGLGDTNLTYGEERAWDLVVDEDDSIYLTGAFGGTVNFNPRFPNAKWTTNSGSASGLFLARFAPDGSNVWAIGLGANLTDVFTEGYSTVAVDGNGHCWLAGNFRGTCDFDPGPGVSSLTSRGLTDIFLARYGMDGSFRAVYQAGGTGQDICSPGAMRSDGTNLYLTGRFGGTADFDPGTGVSNLTAVGGNNLFLASYDGTGTLRWAFNMPTSGEVTGQGGHRVALDASANCYVAGWSGGTTDFDPNPFSTSNLVAHSTNAADVFLAKYTSAGSLLWMHGFGSTNPGGAFNNIAAGLALDSDGSAFITGQFYGPDADFDPSGDTAALTSMGQNDCFVAKYSPDGERSRGRSLLLDELSVLPSDQISFRWFALRDLQYTVQANGDLLSTNWTAGPDFRPTADGYVIHTNTTGITDTKFFRVEGR